MTGKPWRKRVGVFLVNRGKLVCGKVETDGWSGYVIPGGGVEEGESNVQAAERECVEEIGLTVKNMMQLSESIIRIEYGAPAKNVPVDMKKRILERLKGEHKGSEEIAYFSMIKSFDKAKSEYDIVEIPIDEAITFFIEHARTKGMDSYNAEKAWFIVAMLGRLKIRLNLK